MCRADTPLAQPKLPAGAVLFNRARQRSRELQYANRRNAECHGLRGQIGHLTRHVAVLQQTVHTLQAAAGATLGKTVSAPMCC